MKYAVVLVAAGNGERLGLGIPKALVKIDSKTILEHALGVISELDIDQLVVVAHEDHLSEFEAIVQACYSGSYAIAPGGDSRQGSVENGLRLVSSDKVLIHDAARCFTPASVFAAVGEALVAVDCVIPAVTVTDTIKVVEADQVQTTLDRNKLRAAQTPQGFTTEILKAALESTQEQFTDEAALMQAQGHTVQVVQGDQLASKITTSNDLAKATQDSSSSSGIGTDVHKFSQAGTLVLGCLEWSELPKLEGHSDGDAIAHAIVDAVLSGAALGDIGSNFGVDRPEYAGASGEVFLTEAIRLANARGFEIENIAVQVVADKPKIGPRRNELESKLSSIVGAPVSVGATTTDGLGFLSDSRGVAAVATALLRRRS